MEKYLREKRMSSSTTVPIYKIRMAITGTEAVVNVCGDYHYGTGHVTKQDVMTALNEVADKHKGNIFRVLTGDLVENALKSSVGHNYDIEIADPAIQKKDMIDVLTKTNKHLYGEQTWKKLKVNDENIKTFNDVLVVGVEGNHEYRTRKASGQWLSREIHEPSKVLDMGFGGIIELTIFNKKRQADELSVFSCQLSVL